MTSKDNFSVMLRGNNRQQYQGDFTIQQLMTNQNQNNIAQFGVFDKVKFWRKLNANCERLSVIEGNNANRHVYFV